MITLITMIDSNDDSHDDNKKNTKLSCFDVFGGPKRDKNSRDGRVNFAKSLLESLRIAIIIIYNRL